VPWAEDLSVFFDADEFATSATLTRASGGAPVQGLILLDSPGTNLLDDVTSVEYSCQFRTSVWPAVVPGDVIQAGAASFRVRRADRLDDGAVTRAWLVHT
jgi:hypothetical protein